MLRLEEKKCTFNANTIAFYYYIINMIENVLLG